MIILNAFLFKGMAHSIIFGAIMAGVFSPLKKWITLHLKISKLGASLLTILAIVLLVILPGFYILAKISKESISLFHIFQEGLSKKAINDFFFGTGYGAELIERMTSFLGIEMSTSQVEQRLLSTAKISSSYLFNILNNFFSNLFSFLINFSLMILTTFSLLYEGDKLKKFLLELSPLPDEQEELIVKKFNQMNYVTLVCNGIGGLIQGFLAAIGLFLAGVESIFLWFVLMVILAFIPFVGISVITIPTSLYFILTGETRTGVILFVYTTIISLLVENLYKPKFIGSRIQINGMLVFFYIIGGMSLFGMLGIFYGPLILSVSLTIVELYHSYYYPQKKT